MLWINSYHYCPDNDHACYFTKRAAGTCIMYTVIIIMQNMHHMNTTKCYVVSYYQVPGSLVVVIDIFLSLSLNIMSSVSGSLAYNNSNTYHTSKGGHSKAKFTLCSFNYFSI